MRSDQARSLVRTRPAGLRGRSRSRRTRRELPPRRRATTMPTLPMVCPTAQPTAGRDLRGEPANLRRHDVDLAVEDRYHRGQDAVREGDDELDQRLPVHADTYLPTGRPRQLGTEACDCGRLSVTVSEPVSLTTMAAVARWLQGLAHLADCPPGRTPEPLARCGAARTRIAAR
jgi:hypothetical protein